MAVFLSGEIFFFGTLRHRFGYVAEFERGRPLPSSSKLHRQALAAGAAAARQHLATIGRGHAGTETVGAFTGKLMWLIGHFHWDRLPFFMGATEENFLPSPLPLFSLEIVE